MTPRRATPPEKWQCRGVFCLPVPRRLPYKTPRFDGASNWAAAGRAFCGCNSVVEYDLAKVGVVSSNLITRSRFEGPEIQSSGPSCFIASVHEVLARCRKLAGIGRF